MCDQRGRCGAAGARVVLHDRRLTPRRRQPPGKSPGDDIDAPAGPEWIDDPYRAVRKGPVAGHGRRGHRRLSPTRPGETAMPPASQHRGWAPWPPGWESSKRNHRSVRGIGRRRWPVIARRSVPRSLSPHCPPRGAGVNGASRLLAGHRPQRSSGNHSPLRPLNPVALPRRRGGVDDLVHVPVVMSWHVTAPMTGTANRSHSPLWRSCGVSVGILVRAGAACVMGHPSLPALSQVRGLTITATLAPAPRLELGTCRLTAGRSAD